MKESEHRSVLDEFFTISAEKDKEIQKLKHQISEMEIQSMEAVPSIKKK